MKLDELGELHIIGAGNVGSTLAILLSEAGLRVKLYYHTTPPLMASEAGVHLCRGMPEAGAQLKGSVIVATRDDAVTSVADALRSVLTAGQVVLQTSGARAAAEALAPLAEEGVSLGTLHPLVAISNVEQGLGRIPECTIAVEGDDNAVRVGTCVVGKLSATPRKIEAEQMALYHAGAVMASNHVVALWQAVIDLWERAGISDHESGLDMLVPLLRSNLENVEKLGLPRAITGPVRRGDAGTVEHHLAALAALGDGELWASYRADAALALRAAEGLGSGKDLARIRVALESAKAP